ncbi:hypothetical protein VPH35_091194 [Triticum aestivum]
MGMADKRSAARKAGLITKALDRCWTTPARNSKPVEGCFSVYVGAGRQRFMVRTECVNHPLFRALLEEAEEVFGYADAGPLELPCNAEAFARVLQQIKEEKQMVAGRRCTFEPVTLVTSIYGTMSQLQSGIAQFNSSHTDCKWFNGTTLRLINYGVSPQIICMQVSTDLLPNLF